MPCRDFSALTDAQLATMLAAYTSALTGAPLNSKRYKVGTREKENPSLTEIADVLSDISAEITSRADETGGTGIVEFGEPV